MLKMILATGLNGELGQNNQLLMHLPEDLKHFKKVTEGKVVVMGHKTAESLPNGKPLPNRVNIVMTRKPYENGCEGFLRCNDYKKVLKIAETEDVFIIGGAEIYKLFEDYVKEVYHTIIGTAFENADTFYNVDDYMRHKTNGYVCSWRGDSSHNGIQLQYFKFTKLRVKESNIV